MSKEKSTQEITDLIHQFAGLSKCLPQFVDVVLNDELNYTPDSNLASTYDALVRNMQALQDDLARALETSPTPGEMEALEYLSIAVVELAKEQKENVTVLKNVKRRFRNSSFLLQDPDGKYYEVSVREVSRGVSEEAS